MSGVSENNKQQKIRDYGIARLCLVASLIGVITGVLSILFNVLLAYLVSAIGNIDIIDKQLLFAILPMVGGFLLFILYRYLIDPEHRKFGVAQVWQEMRSINQFIMRPKQVFVKMLGTFITLASGLSAGKQGPIVHIGGSVGSNIGYLFNFKRDQVRILIACGVAGALSAAFNEPVFASVFVLEVLLKRDFLQHMAPVFLSSIVAAIIRQLLYQDKPFLIFEHTFASLEAQNYPLLIGLGVVCGIVAGLYIYTLKVFSKTEDKYTNSFEYFPLIAGLIIALTGLFLPQIFDLHFGTTSKVLLGSFGLFTLLLIIIVKIVVTAITLGFGGLGGGFMPGILIGASTGGAFSLILQQLSIQTDYSTFAFLGMIGVFSGFSTAPLSATLMAVELSGNKDLVIPIFLTAAISAIVTESLAKQSIYMKNH